MQPLTLKAFDRLQKRILIINGYELTKDNTICVFGTHYNSFYKPFDITILRSSGIMDFKGVELFESDVVYNSKDDFIGIVKFRNGAFICEGVNKLSLEWPPSMFIKYLDNFLLNPLALEAKVN